MNGGANNVVLVEDSVPVILHVVCTVFSVYLSLDTHTLSLYTYSLLLFTVPQVSPHYKTSGIHYHVLPRALPVAQIMLTGSIYSTLAVTVER